MVPARVVALLAREAKSTRRADPAWPGVRSDRRNIPSGRNAHHTWEAGAARCSGLAGALLRGPCQTVLPGAASRVEGRARLGSECLHTPSDTRHDAGAPQRRRGWLQRRCGASVPGLQAAQLGSCPPAGLQGADRRSTSRSPTGRLGLITPHRVSPRHDRPGTTARAAVSSTEIRFRIAVENEGRHQDYRRSASGERIAPVCASCDGDDWLDTRRGAEVNQHVTREARQGSRT